MFILPSWRLFHCSEGLSKIACLDIINDIVHPLPPHIMTDHYGRTTEHLLSLRLTVCCGNVFRIHPGIGFTRCCHTQLHAQVLKTHTNSGWTQCTAAAEWSTRTWKTLLMHAHWPFQGLVFWFTKVAHWLCSKPSVGSMLSLENIPVFQSKNLYIFSVKKKGKKSIDLHEFSWLGLPDVKGSNPSIRD